MTTLPPSPFVSESAAAPPTADDPAAAQTPMPSAAAGDPSRFVLDEDRFMADIEAAPAFISAPSQDYLDAVCDRYRAAAQRRGLL